MIASKPEVPVPFANTIITIANQSFVAGMNDAMFIGALMILPSRIRSPREEARPVEGLDAPGVAVVGD